MRGVRPRGGDGRGARRVRGPARSPSRAGRGERAPEAAGRPDLARASPRFPAAARPLRRGARRRAASAGVVRRPVRGRRRSRPPPGAPGRAARSAASPPPGSGRRGRSRCRVTASVAFSSRARPASVISTSVARRSVGWGTRRTRPSACSRSTMLVTLVGCSCSRSPITRIGSRPLREKRQQHQRLVPGEGQAVRPQRAVDRGEQDLLHAHHAGDRGHRARGPMRSSHSCAARMIGSNGRGSRGRMAGDVSSVGPAALRPPAPGGAASARTGQKWTVAVSGRDARWLRQAGRMLFAFSVAPSGGGRQRRRRGRRGGPGGPRVRPAQRDHLDVHHDRGRDLGRGDGGGQAGGRGGAGQGAAGEPGAQGRHPARPHRAAAGQGRAGGAGARRPERRGAPGRAGDGGGAGERRPRRARVRRQRSAMVSV